MLRHKTALALAASLLFTGCGDSEPQTRQDADLLLWGGEVLTLDELGSTGTAVAVRNGRIVAVGDDTLRERYNAAESVDLGGRTLMPGFIDSHTHISGSAPWHLDLTEVPSIAAMQRAVSELAATLEPGAWITGYGWSEDQLEEGRRPLRGDLDIAAPDNPVVLTRAGGHSAVCSSKALALAGIDASTPEPDGGVIERGEDGEPNGIIRERQDLVTRLVPEASADDLHDSFIAALSDQLALGITSVVQASDRIANFPAWQRAYAEAGERLPRAAVQVAWEGVEAMAAFGLRSGDGDAQLRVGAIKVFVDGGFTGPAAYTREPYRGEESYRGKLNIEPEALETLMEEAHRAGWQLGLHAIGDAAIELTVATLARVLERSPRADHRHYLNHFTMLPPTETLELMAQHHIAITQQPNFTYTLEGRYVDYLDGERLERNNPLRTPMVHGVHLALSSDILPMGPMTGIYAAVTRKGMSGRVFGPEEKLTRLEALRGYTSKGAFLTREESDKGALAAGRLADMIVLSANPMTTPDAELLSIEVLETYIGGKRVYALPRARASSS